MRWTIGFILVIVLSGCNEPLDLNRHDPEILPLVEQKWNEYLEEKKEDCFITASLKANLIADSLMKQQALKRYDDSLAPPTIPPKPEKPDFIKIDSILVTPVIEE